MSTVTKLGPTANGQPLTLEEFETSDFDEGYKYELIDGRLFVLPLPDPDENVIERWLDRKLSNYSQERSDIINFVTNKPCVLVCGRRLPTYPEPDIAAYDDFPVGTALKNLRWRDLFPILVVEVMTGDSDKDLTRNVELYFQVASIREYWVIDARDDAERPTLIQHRRHGKRWVVREFPYGSTFTTRLLPGFELLIDPRE